MALVWWRGVVVVLEKIFSFKKSFKISCDYKIFAGIVFCTHKFFLNFEINFSQIFQTTRRHLLDQSSVPLRSYRRG